MSLAKAPLEKREKDFVLEYLTLCRTFCKSGASKLDEWSGEVRKGATPEFGANLIY